MKTSKIIFYSVFGLFFIWVFYKKDEIVEYIEGSNILENISSSLSGVVSMVEETFDALYRKWGGLMGVDWRLLKAIAMTESDENPNAIGDSGTSFGLMQVQNLVGNYYGQASGNALLEPDKNIEVGSKFLADLISKYGVDGGIQAYNLGETKYRQGLTSPTYLSRVMTNYNSLEVVAA